MAAGKLPGCARDEKFALRGGEGGGPPEAGLVYLRRGRGLRWPGEEAVFGPALARSYAVRAELALCEGAGAAELRDRTWVRTGAYKP